MVNPAIVLFHQVGEGLAGQDGYRGNFIKYSQATIPFYVNSLTRSQCGPICGH